MSDKICTACLQSKETKLFYTGKDICKPCQLQRKNGVATTLVDIKTHATLPRTLEERVVDLEKELTAVKAYLQHIYKQGQGLTTSPLASFLPNLSLPPPPL